LADNLHGLSEQMILSFVGLVLLTAIAVGLPAMWLVRERLENEAWARVAQGERSVQALYAAEQSEMRGLAALTAQRPTLQELLAHGDPEAVTNYVDTLRTGARLDLMLVCDTDERAVAWSGSHSHVQADEMCGKDAPAGILVGRSDGGGFAWLLASHAVEDAGSSPLGRVVVAVALNDAFALKMLSETGLEHTVLVGDQPVASSLATVPADRQWRPLDSNKDPLAGLFSVAGEPYYARRLRLSTEDIGTAGAGPALAEVALPVADINSAQDRLLRWLGAAIVAAAAVGSALGIVLARRIADPLGRLTTAATALSRGDLDAEVTAETQVREVALVAQALEQARVDLRRSLEQLRLETTWADQLLDAMVEGVVSLDGAGRIAFFSPGAERITGWTREAVLLQPCDEVFRTVEPDAPFSHVIPPPGRRHKVTIELADSRHVTLAITGAEVAPPGQTETATAVVFRDVSEEEAMHRLMGHFLANVSHEFRTPLSALAVSVELLLDQAADLTQTELRELLSSLHLSIMSLRTLVDNLLQGASIEAGRFRVSARPCRLDQIAAEAVRVMRPVLDRHGQALDIDLPEPTPVVRADRRRTVQVLVNLLSNASRYGPDDATISLTAEIGIDVVRVSVGDCGPGIAPEERSDLFRRFMHSGTSDEGTSYGIGLGLSVVKAIVTALGGEVGVEERAGGGSVFWFTLLLEDE
jgi:signal transduction histidine kinase